MQFIKSFHLKYGIYKPREVVNPINYLPPPLVYKSHISNGTVNKLYLIYKEALAIRCVFSLVDIITNTKFSNCTVMFLKLVRFGSKICKVSIKICFKAIYH